MPIYRWGALSDTHAPLTDKASWNWALDRLEEHKPDVLVHCGDWFEGKRGSRHVQDERHTWSAVQEFQAVAAQVREVNERFPDAQKVWLWGNHDANFLTYVPGHQTKQDAETHAALFDAILGDLFTGWHVIRRYNTDTSWKLGQICFRHGYAISEAGIRKEIVEHVPYNGLLVMGHTHRPYAVTQLEINRQPLPWWHCNLGHHARDTDMHYMDRQDRARWGNAVAIGEVSAPGLKEGGAIANRPNWAAEVLIRQLNTRHHHNVKLR